MSQPPQGPPPYGPDGRPLSWDQPPAGGWGLQPSEWTCTGGEQGGQVAWTDDQHLTEGVVRAPGATQAERSALYDWWTADSEYQG
jgi:hypothetical protein